MLGGEEGAGPPAPGLDLVGDHQDPVLAAQRRQPREEVGGGDHEPPLALDGLHYGGGHGLGIHDGDEGPLDRLQRQPA